MLTVTNANGIEKIKNEYDENMRLNKQTVNTKNRTEYQYDPLGRVTSKKIFDVSSGEELYNEKTSYSYYDLGSGIRGFQKKVTVDGGIQDGNKRPDIESISVTDVRGNLRREQKGDIYTEYGYDYAGNVIWKKEANNNDGFMTNYEYGFDTSGMLRVKEVNEVGGEKEVISNWIGEKISEKTKTDSNKYDTATYKYDGRGNKTQTEKSIGSMIYAYDNNGNKTSETTGTDKKTVYEYDTLNRVTKVISPNGNYSTNVYDQRGNLTETTYGSGTRKIKYEYDKLDRVIRCINPMGNGEKQIVSEETYEYDEAGNMTKKTIKNGWRKNYTEYSYDALGRVINEENKNGDFNSYKYSKAGMIISEKNSNQTISYYYNKAGNVCLMKTKYGNVPYEIRFEYDKGGNLSSENYYANGASSITNYTDYQYDEANRLQYVKDNGVNSRIAEYVYNVGNQITKLKYANGSVTDYTYVTGNRIASVANNKGLSCTYSYYNDGQMKSKSENGVTTSYTYDDEGRLISEKEGNSLTKNYDYDKAGNRIKMTVSGNQNYVADYTYNLNNMLKEEIVTDPQGNKDTTFYDYDERGNEILQIKRRYDINDIRHDSSLGIYKADELDSIKKTYDGFNRLIKYEDGENTAEYEYNAKGQRISKKVNGTKSMALWNGDNIAFELNATGGMVRKFARGYDLIRSNDGKYYLHNGHGDVVSITNNSGTVIKSYSYDSFGNEKNIDKNDTNPWRYCGEYYDNETGSIYLRARYYDPGTGRFMTEDPARDGVNWYSYCGGNPVILADKSGLKPTELEAAAMAEHIYNYASNIENNNKIVLVDGKKTQWQLAYIKSGSEGLIMGIYAKTGNEYDVKNPLEYAVVNKGTDPYNFYDWKNDFQEFLGFSSNDMKDSIEIAKDFVSKHKNYEITFIGHSKGGAEAAVNALATGKDAMLFNPLAVNLDALDLNYSQYKGNMTAYIVVGDALDFWFGPYIEPIDKVEYLPQQYSESFPMGQKNLINNHLPKAVISALKEKGYE
ncbi:MAG: hypothetical protein IJ583_08285 [Firmicutes bacterium]|nr:hypothetical protein [Bacillota bacterium]